MAKQPPNPAPEWDAPPPVTPRVTHGGKGWSPALNPTQQKIFDETAKYVLAYGEKGSGKSFGCLHALVRHCYENKDALALIIGLTVFTAKEGAMYILENKILPAWRDGNRYPEWVNGERHPKAGELMDSGIGLEYTSPQQDPVTKDTVVWIGNQHGGWSKVILRSIPYAAAVEPRMKGPEPSFIYVEELANATGEEYFTLTSAQLGRRSGIQGPQQFYASCNPEGPSNWVYQTWWVKCVNEENGRRDPDFAVYHVPIVENIDRMPPGYVERLYQLFKDPIERRRLIDGEWVDRPSGDSIFKNYFEVSLHQIGDALKGIGWIPIKGFPIVIGYDPGPVNFSIHLMQFIPTKEKSIWVVFDEINFVGTYTPNFRVVPKLLKRMDYWNDVVGTTFQFVHIADEAAFNQQRSDGSFDSAEIERLGAGRIKLRPCPKGRESVPQRVQMVISMLLEEMLYVSATCPKTLDMIRMLASKKAEPGKYVANIGLIPIRSVYIHPFDSMTYPIFYFQLQPGKFPTPQDVIVPQVYRAGGG